MEKKTWEEFRNTGLLLFINSFLHIFGWAIIIETKKRPSKESEFICAYPARVACRGFKSKSYDDAYANVQNYMENNIEGLKKDFE